MFVTNTAISNFSLWKRTYVPGLFWQGVGNTYSYNTIHNGPHNCVLGGGNEDWPWGQGHAKSGDGSQNLFSGNILDTCVYECGVSSFRPCPSVLSNLSRTLLVPPRTSPKLTFR